MYRSFEPPSWEASKTGIFERFGPLTKLLFENQFFFPSEKFLSEPKNIIPKSKKKTPVLGCFSAYESPRNEFLGKKLAMGRRKKFSNKNQKESWKIRVFTKKLDLWGTCSLLQRRASYIWSSPVERAWKMGLFPTLLFFSPCWWLNQFSTAKFSS